MFRPVNQLSLRLWVAMLAALPAAASAQDAAPAAQGILSTAPQQAQNHAHPWQLDMVEAVSPLKDRIHHMHNYLLVIITVITLFTVGVLGYACVRFRESRNPVPSKTTHNTLLEVLWTGIPVLILVAIAIKSIPLLSFADHVPKNVYMTLKVVGHQWYWEYEYPDQGIHFDSNIKDRAAAEAGNEMYLFAVDNRIVVPVGKVVRVQLTSADVIHSFGMPSMALKTDAVPGHLNETWFQADKTGVYYGQCSELCGIKHGFMPIVIQVVSEPEFLAWVEQAKKQFSANGSRSVAAAQ